MGNRPHTPSTLHPDDGETDLKKLVDVDPRKIVIEKILANPVYASRLKKDETMLQKFTTILSSKEELKNTYLTRDWIETVKLYKEIKENVHQLENHRDSVVSTDTSSTGVTINKFTSESTVSPSEVEKMKQHIAQTDTSTHEDDEEDEKTLEEEFKKAQLFIPEVKLKNNIKVKLIIAEIAQNQARKTFRKLVSPVLSKLDVLPEFGLFHSFVIYFPVTTANFDTLLELF